jgi:acetyl/propionyl-CoA carboxylase alpha subunit
VREADDAVLIGAAPARESYLDADKILVAALSAGVEAIHPGYGFLSENAVFAQAVADAGLIFVGPSPGAIAAMGRKDEAKARMIAAGVPTTPGYLGADQSDATLAAEAEKIGYPVLIKAVSGGGGKGMRKVASAADFAASLASCRREATQSFGDDRVLLETYVARPRHIEVQVFGDSQGEVVHLFERDCSLQRRHQKVIEEAPAPGLPDDARAFICDAAIRAAKAVDYVGAGTIEFIADASQGLRADRIWFMEMNTRLQVEHPVTESVTGVDLVEWQLRIASGEPLPLSQDEIRLNGHAVEARLYAENPAAGFLPSIGRLDHFVLPSDVRIDAGVEEGGEISTHYDPMIAKLIAHGATREAAFRRLAKACGGVEVYPVQTNAGFLKRLLDDPDVRAGDIDTGLIEARREELVTPPAPSEAALNAAARSLRPVSEGSPWTDCEGFRLNAPPRWTTQLTSNGAAIAVTLSAPFSTQPPPSLFRPAHDDAVVVFEDGFALVFRPAELTGAGAGAAGDGDVLAPMPGRIVQVQTTLGASVRRGEPLVTLEAMKMEHVLTAPFDGVVAQLLVSVGGQTTEGALIAKITPVSD